ncbi:MAG: hypothetical protein GX930_04110 [Clostridia bacterium]|nr:hypothetical protein [Clostridia bacterium]
MSESAGVDDEGEDGVALPAGFEAQPESISVRIVMTVTKIDVSLENLLILFIPPLI